MITDQIGLHLVLLFLHVFHNTKKCNFQQIVFVMNAITQEKENRDDK